MQRPAGRESQGREEQSAEAQRRERSCRVQQWGVVESGGGAI